MKKSGYVCPNCGHEFVQGESNYNYDFGVLEFDCPECGWNGTDKMLDNDEDESPYNDIIDYAEKYGYEALGYALYQVAKNKDAEIDWDLVREIWEYDGANYCPNDWINK